MVILCWNFKTYISSAFYIYKFFTNGTIKDYVIQKNERIWDQTRNEIY